MKNKLNLIIVVFALLTFTSLVIAQENEDIEKQIEGKIERLPEQKIARPILNDVAALTELAGKKCPLGMQQTITAGVNDNFAGTTEPTFQSPAFLSVFPNPPTLYKNFDDKTVNRVVAHSFMLNKYKPCESKICTALLEMRVCNYGKDAWWNDHLYVGTIINNQLSATLFNGSIWQQNEAKKCKNISIPINGSAIASWTEVSTLIQDDTAVDYMKLTLNY